MPWVTEEEIQAAKNMTAYEYLRTHQAQRLQKTRTRNEWQLTDHDSFKINELSSKWHWKSRDIGGVSALRFLIEVDGMKFTDAVKLLCEESPSFIPTQSVKKEKPPFKLPERYCNCRRIRAYLNHRGISDEVITYCILHEIIYVFLTIFLYLLKCPQSLILSALRAFCFCGKPHISRSIFLYFLYQTWLKSW